LNARTGKASLIVAVFIKYLILSVLHASHFLRNSLSGFSTGLLQCFSTSGRWP